MRRSTVGHISKFTLALFVLVAQWTVASTPDSTLRDSIRVPPAFSPAQRDSVCEALKLAVRDPSREIYLLDVNYVKNGPITSFRDDKFRVWDTPTYIPVDSVAGLYEYRTYSGRGALIGFLGPLVVGAALAVLQKQSDLIFVILGQAEFGAFIGWVIGSTIKESTSWPADTFRK